MLEQAQISFAPLFGKPCWRVQRGYGSFLTFEFGEPHLEIHEPRAVGAKYSPRVRKGLARRRVFVHGDWHLWIYCCDWIVTVRGECVGESSTRERMDRAAAALDGQAINRVTLDTGTGHWSFDFDLGGRLETRPCAETGSGDEQWRLYEPSGCVLTVRGNGSFSHAPGDGGGDERLREGDVNSGS